MNKQPKTDLTYGCDQTNDTNTPTNKRISYNPSAQSGFSISIIMKDF